MSRLNRRLHEFRATITEGRGTLTSTALLHSIDPSVMAALLPRGLRPHAAATEARLLLLLSRNHFTSWFGDMVYFEMILAIPDVTTGHGPPSTYFRRLYLDRALPRRLGNIIYGFEKLPAHITWDGLNPDQSGVAGIAPESTHRIRTTAGAPILTATWRAAPLEVDPAPLAEVLSQPLLSQTSRRRRADAATTHGGPFARTQVDTEVTPDQRVVIGDVHFEDAFNPPELAGLTLSHVTAVTLQATQVIGLPRRIKVA